MTNDEINLAIAEHLGWTEFRRLYDLASTTWMMNNTGGIRKTSDHWLGLSPHLNAEHPSLVGKERPSSTWWVSVPDYCGDLNVMRDVEESLGSKVLEVDYCDQLQGILARDNDGKFRKCGVSHWEYLHASAVQRAEALLLTVGKWKD